MSQEYVLDGLRASADEVLAGLGDVVVRLAELVLRGAGMSGLAQIEDLFASSGREVLRSALQLDMDVQAGAEQRLAAVAGADGITRRYAERDHGRRLVTEFGEVIIRRIGYRSRGKGQPNLYPRDAVLNLPPGPYSWRLQELAVRLAREVSCDTARELMAAATGITIGKRQMEEITAAAAAGVPGFYAGPADQQHQDQDQDQDQDGDGGGGGGGGDEVALPLMLSSDGKGVAMRPQSRRARTKAPQEKVKNFQSRAGIGEKGTKRIAQVACVADVIPQPRTPEQVMASCHGGAAQDAGTAQAGRQKKPAPVAAGRRYRVDIAADRKETTRWLFDEGERRDPGHDRDWVALLDGDNHQITLIEAEAARRGITVTILIDLIHVLEYLWKAGWAFHKPRDPAIETWTITQVLDILHGRAGQVITRIRELAEQHPPTGSEHQKNITRVLGYLEAKQPCLDYPAALKAGWPIATGVIEGYLGFEQNFSTFLQVSPSRTRP